MRGKERDRGEGGARIARLSLLVFVVSLVSGIGPCLHGTTTGTPHVDVDATSIFTGTLEFDRVRSGWAGSLLLRARLANLSFTGEPPPLIDRSVGSETLGALDAFEKLGFVEYTEVARRRLQQMVARWPGQPGHFLRCRQS